MMQDRKTVVVTGAAGGIGRAACECLAAAGWNVLAVDRDHAKLAWTDAAGIVGISADISSEADNTKMIAKAQARFGGVDAAIFNAGVTGSGSIEDVSMADFRRVLDINLCGTVLGIRAVLPALRARGGGAIAVTSSTMGMAADAENWAYCTSKHALIGIVRSLAREIAWQGIRINALCPGLTQDTGMTAAIRERTPAQHAHLASAVPLQRWANAHEMATVLEFLISPASSYVNGHALVADGGAMIGTGLAPPASSNAVGRSA